MSDRKYGDGTLRAVEVLDDAFRIDLVVRRRVVDSARQQQAREFRRLDHLAAGVAHAHRQCQPVAVDILAAPVRVRPRRPLVARNGAHVAAAGQDRFRAVRRHPRQHEEPHVAQSRVDRGGPVRVGCIACRPQMQAQHVLGDRQRHARAAEFAGVHVAVHPRARPHPVGFGTERQQPQLATLGRLADRRRATDIGKRIRPRAHLPREFIVGEETIAKSERKCFETGDLIGAHCSASALSRASSGRSAAASFQYLRASSFKSAPSATPHTRSASTAPLMPGAARIPPRRAGRRRRRRIPRSSNTSCGRAGGP